MSKPASITPFNTAEILDPGRYRLNPIYMTHCLIPIFDAFNPAVSPVKYAAGILVPEPFQPNL